VSLHSVSTPGAAALALSYDIGLPPGFAFLRGGECIAFPRRRNRLMRSASSTALIHPPNNHSPSYISNAPSHFESCGEIEVTASSHARSSGV
jgi:hypothetical protein